MRLDIAITERYWYSRNKAKSFIENGLVLLNANICNKSSMEVSEWDIITLKNAPELEWVSRSAGKLEWFFSELWVQKLSGKTALDIGSSTWGFTQILLTHDITHVDAVDVWSNQLHLSLRSDARVSSYENTDIRTFPQKTLYDIITIDVSFISLREIVPVLRSFLHQHTDIYILFKPQFEVGRENLRKTGVPKDEKMILSALDQFIWLLSESGYRIQKVSKASVVGEAGNQEYMIYITSL